MKTYALMNKITGRRGTSNAAWEAFKAFAKDYKNGLPSSGRKLLKFAKGDKDGEKAHERFHHLLLDSLKKDRETKVKEGLAAAALQREQTANDSDKDLGRPITPKGVIVRVIIIDPDNPTDVTNDGGYYWATAKVRQFVALKKIIVAEVMNSISNRIPEGRYIRAMYGALTKPPADDTEPEDIERITSDDDLTNFVMLAKGVYAPVMIQAQLAPNKPDDESDPETPPLDELVYFRKDQFDLVDKTYNPVVSDSENELYLMKFGKSKAKAWRHTDHEFEHSKAKIWKRITRLRKPLQEVQACHKKFKGAKKNEIVDSDDDDVFSWVRWLNPQRGKDFVKARAAARAGAHHLSANANNEKGAEVAAKAKFGKPHKGDFN